MVTLINIIGYLAATLTVLGLIPQLYVIIKHKSSKDISITMFTMSFISQILWFTFAYSTVDLQLMLTSSISGVFIIFIIGYTIYYRNSKDVPLLETKDIYTIL